MTDIDLTAVVDRYLAVWNEPDAPARGAALAALLTEDARYTDPLADVRGPQGLGAVVEQVRAQLPGFTIRRAGPVDAHHHIARFTWEAVPDGGGEAPVVGFDVIATDADGRIHTVHGFLDRVPEAG
ncbi:nuclear transport factor 2 family protein [Streptomyces capparidis]|jgi:hypothetical protein